MKRVVTFFALIYLLQVALAGSPEEFSNNIKQIKWEELEVVWLEDNRFPTYDIIFYFADGSLSDSKGEYGVTTSMFNLMDSGTRRFNQKEISDNLEFYGTSYGSRVAHEFSSFEISGLAKDITPTIKQICHLFNDATFPKKELAKYKVRRKDSLNNLVNSHGALARRAFRELSLEGSPYAYPPGGKLRDLPKLTSKILKTKLNYFNGEVKKRIYITGPKSLLSIKNIVLEECGWGGEKSNFVRTVNYNNLTRDQAKIYLITVPKANQAHVMMGRFLNRDEINNSELLSFTAGFLGGGFTSMLMRAVRVNAGLTYGIYAFAGGQKEYGRSGIATSTGNESLEKLIKTINGTVNKIELNKFSPDSLEWARGHLLGSYLFSFERSDALLSQLMTLDHEGKAYSELYKFPENLKSITREDIVRSVANIFSWGKQVVVVLGSKKLKGQLSKFGQVKAMSYEDFL